MPEVAKQWHPTKNGDLTARDVSSGSNFKVWWLCPNKTCEAGCAHEWEVKVNDRKRGRGCPWCCKGAKRVCVHNSLAGKFPELAKEWHPTRNAENKHPYEKGATLRPENVTSHSNVIVWWRCPKTNCAENCAHDYQASIIHRVYGSGCPYCAHNSVKFCVHNSLKGKHHDVADEWHPTKNGSLSAEDVTPQSNRKVWWCCKVADCKYEWQTCPKDRTGKNKTGCPRCQFSQMQRTMHDLLTELPVSPLSEFKICDVHSQARTWLKPTGQVADHCFQMHHGEYCHRAIVEVDGRHHFEPVEVWGGAKRLKEMQTLDRKKDAFCQQNNIHLLRIDDTVSFDTYPQHVATFLQTIVAQQEATPVICRVGTRYEN